MLATRGDNLDQACLGRPGMRIRGWTDRAPRHRSDREKSMGRSLEVVLENRLEEIHRLAEQVDAFCEDAGVAPAHAFNLNLALDELITNVVLYGYEDDATHEIRVVLSVSNGALHAELVDDGKPFDPIENSPELQAPELPVEDRRIGGLGLHLVRKMMDSVEYRRDGHHNRLSLSKRIPPAEPTD